MTWLALILALGLASWLGWRLKPGRPPLPLQTQRLLLDTADEIEGDLLPESCGCTCSECSAKRQMVRDLRTLANE